MPEEPKESVNPAPQEGTASPPGDAATQGPREHQPDSFRCPACQASEHTEADEQAIQQDPATRSLSQALATSFTLLKVVMIALLIFFALECVTFVKQGSVGLVRRFGRYVTYSSGPKRGEVVQYQPGDLVFVWPAPIEVFREVSLQEQTISLNQAFWPKIVQRSKELEEDAKTVPVAEELDPTRDSYNLTGDLNILHSRWQVRYKVTNPVRFELAVAETPRPGVEVLPGRLLRPEDALTAADIVREIVTAAILRNVAGMTVDDVLYYKKDVLFGRIYKDIKAEMIDAAGEPFWGIEVVGITNDGIFPPGKAAPAFENVIGARSEQKGLESKAMAEVEEILKQAQSEADQIRNEALAYKADVVDRAAGDAKHLEAILARFPNDPSGLHLYLQQYRYDALKEILGQLPVHIVRQGKQDWYVMGSGATPLLNEDEKEKK